jgi:hypothetical protein
LPTEDIELNVGIFASAVRGVEVTRFSGVFALKTAGCACLRSGVFGLDREAGPETTRFDIGRVTGVLGSWLEAGGMEFDRGTVATELDKVGGETTFSTLGPGIGPLAPASLFCRLCTLRVRDSTLVVSFFFSLSILFHFVRLMVRRSGLDRSLLKDAIVMVLDFRAFTLQQFVHVAVFFLKFRHNTVELGMRFESG